MIDRFLIFGAGVLLVSTPSSAETFCLKDKVTGDPYCVEIAPTVPSVIKIPSSGSGSSGVVIKGGPSGGWSAAKKSGVFDVLGNKTVEIKVSPDVSTEWAIERNVKNIDKK